MEGIIHIAGVMPRIGTTTIAMQLIYFLKRMSYDAAYIEMNTQDYIWSVTSLYQDVLVDKMPGKVSCAGIDLYSRERKNVLTAGGTQYDYLICDFGNLLTSTFDMGEFSNCGAMVLVAGNKANEVFNTELALKNKAYEDAAYVFNFTRREDEQDILAMMRGHGSRTSFAPYMPDPFIPAGEETNADFYKLMDHVMELLERRS